MTLTRLKIDCIRYDGAAEFAKSATFKAFCVNNRIAMEETAAYMHTFNAIYAHLYRPADGILIDEKTGKTAACRVMAVKAYSRTQAGHFKQIIETFEPLDTIFNEIDFLEEDPLPCETRAVLDTGGGKRMARPVGQGRL